jgi:hypothetical protein
LIFSFLPKSFLDSLKKIFNWDIFFNTLKKGWLNFVNFIEEATGIKFSDVSVRLKQVFGIDIIALWNLLVGLLNKFFNFIFSPFKR